jgi:hypothetical protein
VKEKLDLYSCDIENDGGDDGVKPIRIQILLDERLK